MDLEKDYKKFRWFFTSSDKLVVGGKSAEQNDLLLKYLKSTKKDYVIMHTSSPGSPFSVILSETDNVTQKDLAETAIFTASFSRAWKEKKKSAIIDSFNLSQLHKAPLMKTGTWGVKGKVNHYAAPLMLALVKQKDILRAVPEISVKNKKDIFFKIAPGIIDKQDILLKLKIELHSHAKADEILSALPAGGIKIIRQ